MGKRKKLAGLTPTNVGLPNGGNGTAEVMNLNAAMGRPSIVNE